MRAWGIGMAGWLCFVLSFMMLFYTAMESDRTLNNMNTPFLALRILDTVIFVVGGVTLILLLSMAGERLVSKANHMEHKKEQDMIYSRIRTLLDRSNK